MNKVMGLVLSTSLIASFLSPTYSFAIEKESGPRKSVQLIYENEQGSSIKKATPVHIHSNVVGHIDGLPTDQDLYSLNLKEPQKISLGLQSLASEVVNNLRLEVYDQNMQLMQKSELLYQYAYFEKQQINLSLDPGHYYIKIYSDQTPSTVNQPYSLMIVDQYELPQESKDIQVKNLLPIKTSQKVTEKDVYNYISEHDNLLKLNGEWYQYWLEHFNADDSLFNDPMLKFQYHIPQVNTFEAWKETMGEREIIVAVIDQGIDTENPELKSNSLKVKDMVESDGFGSVKIDHGNHTSGILGAKTNNGVGVSGIAPNVTIMPINAWDSLGKVRTEQSTADAIKYAVDHGARIISMSFGSNGFAPEQEGDSAIVYDAIKYAYEHNVVLVASVSNFGADLPDYPARYKEVIGVGGINGDDVLWKDSNKGADIVAPGENVLSLGINGTYRNISGTSMAAPIVSGAAALILSKNPELSNDQVKDILFRSATDMGDKNLYGYGRLNIGEALKITPNPVRQEEKFKSIENKWYKDTAIDMYNLGVIDLERTKQLEEDITATEFKEMIIKEFGVVEVERILADSMLSNLDKAFIREDAYKVIYNLHQYLYGSQTDDNQDMLTFLLNHNLVNGRGNGDHALGERLKWSEALQLIKAIGN